MHLVLGIRAQRKQHHVVVVAAGGGACQAGGQQQRAFRRGGPVWEPRPPIASPVPHATAQAGQPAGTPGPQAHQLRQQQPLAGLACCWAGEACSNYRGKGPRTRQELRPTWHVVNALPHSVRRGEVKGSAAHRRDLAAGDGDIVHLRCEGKARGQRHPGKGGGRLSPVGMATSSTCDKRCRDAQPGTAWRCADYRLQKHAAHCWRPAKEGTPALLPTHHSQPLAERPRPAHACLAMLAGAQPSELQRRP